MAVLIPELGLCYFPVPKVANTSIKHLVYEIEHGGPFRFDAASPDAPKHIHQEYKTPIFSKVDKNPLEGYLRFAVIRDPVQRLLSVWRNRVAHHFELSAPKVDIDALAKRGLTENPSLDEFVDKLELYREVQASIRMHSAPLVDFLGEDPAYFHHLFRMEELHLIEAFFFALTGIHRTLRRSQTAGPRLALAT